MHVMDALDRSHWKIEEKDVLQKILTSDRVDTLLFLRGKRVHGSLSLQKKLLFGHRTQDPKIPPTSIGTTYALQYTY